MRKADSRIDKLNSLYHSRGVLKEKLRFFTTKKELTQDSLLNSRKGNIEDDMVEYYINRVLNISCRIWMLNIELEKLNKEIDEFEDY
jgi:hypothetical protein